MSVAIPLWGWILTLVGEVLFGFFLGFLFQTYRWRRADQERNRATKKRPGIWLTGMGQTVMVHPSESCTPPCAIHAPSDHAMRSWPTYWNIEEGVVERICPHEIGHPDPDDFKTRMRIRTGTFFDYHHCDGCCEEVNDDHPSEAGMDGRDH